MRNWSAFLHRNLREKDEMCCCGEAVTVNQPRFECILLSILHTIDHAAFLSRCICQDEEVIAVSTLRLPWRQRGFHCCALFPSDPVCARRGGIEALQELSALHSSAFYLAIESSWLMYDWIWESCVCVCVCRRTHIDNSTLRRGNKHIWAATFRQVQLCLFCLIGRRAQILPAAVGKVSRWE